MSAETLSLFAPRERPEVPAQTDLLEGLSPTYRPPDLPGPVAVLRDWLKQERPKLVLDDRRSALDLCWIAAHKGAPSELVKQAHEAAWADWRARTGPDVLLAALAKVRPKTARAGFLTPALLRLGVTAHAEALLLASDKGVTPDNVQTWICYGNYGRASDEVRLRGSAVTVHRLSSQKEEPRQTITYSRKRMGEWTPPEGWYARASARIERSARQWGQP